MFIKCCLPQTPVNDSTDIANLFYSLGKKWMQYDIANSEEDALKKTDSGSLVELWEGEKITVNRTYYQSFGNDLLVGLILVDKKSAILSVNVDNHTVSHYELWADKPTMVMCGCYPLPLMCLSKYDISLRSSEPITLIPVYGTVNKQYRVKLRSTPFSYYLYNYLIFDSGELEESFFKKPSVLLI